MNSYSPFWIFVLFAMCVIVPLLFYVRRHEQSRWRHFASVHRLDYQPVFMEASYSICGYYMERRIKVGFVMRGPAGTGVEISMKHGLEKFRCVVSPGVSLFPKVTKDRILSDDVYLDENFECRGEPHDLVQAVLHLKYFCTLSKQVDFKWTFRHFEIDDQKFILSGPFYARNPSELKELLALLYEFVEKFEKIFNSASLPQNLDESA